jgi:hypothetical protein
VPDGFAVCRSRALRSDQGAADSGEYRQAAGAVAPGDISFVTDQIKSLSQKRKT